MLRHLQNRRTRLAIGAAFLVWVMSAVDSTFAQVNLEKLVTLPDTTVVNSPADPATPNSPTDPASPVVSAPVVTELSPGLASFSAVASVNAREIALVSVAARQVELAKTPAGAKKVAKLLIAQKYKWNSSQVGCLTALWNGESHWNYKARNRRTGAHGIAQAYPATKMETIALDWRTNPVTQLKWGLNYIKVRYNTPCNALAKKHRSGYY